jgi:hypothetical protein
MKISKGVICEGGEDHHHWEHQNPQGCYVHYW